MFLEPIKSYVKYAYNIAVTCGLISFLNLLIFSKSYEFYNGGMS